VAAKRQQKEARAEGRGRPKARTRRTPEESRARILSAAQALLSQHGPDAIGLKEVAAEAGVSHALVTHYFGTYDALVENALAERSNTLRDELLARLASGGLLDDVGATIDRIVEAVAHPLYGRLAIWAILTGRAGRSDFFARRERGLARIVDLLEARGSGEDREELEFLVVLVLTSAVGWTLGRDVLLAALEREEAPGRDAWFRGRLAKLVERMLDEGASPQRSLTERPLNERG
jgi:AcrR family transcriptional regulator